MAHKNPRINVVLERPLYSAVKKMAEDRDISLSLMTRDLVREALETYEDLGLNDLAESRNGTVETRDFLTHEDVWEVT